MKKIIFSLSFISILALAQSYIKGNILYETPTVTTASNGTTALLVTSQPNQVLDGATTHTHSLPNVQTPTPDIATGFTFKFKNRSSGNWTITYQDASTAFTLKPLESAEAVLTSNATANGTWAIKYIEYVRVTGDTMTGGLGLNYTGVTANTAIIVDASRKLVSSAVTSTELGYLSSLTANVQTQLSAKLDRAGDTMTGGLGLDYTGVTANTVAVLNAARRFTSTSIDPTELGYLDGLTTGLAANLNGLTANVQTQINSIMGGVTGAYLPLTGGSLSGNLNVGLAGTSSGILRVLNSASDVRGEFLSSATGAILRSTFGSTGGFQPLLFDVGNAVKMSLSTGGNLSVTGSVNAIQGITSIALSLSGLTGFVKEQYPQGAGAVVTHTITRPGVQGATTSVMVNDGGGTLSWLAAVVLDATIGVKIVGAEVAQTAATTCSITRGYGVSVNCNTSGNVNVDFTNAFSESPWCVTGLSENVNDVSCRGNTPSTSGFTTTCANAAGTGQNRSRSFVCFGKR